MTSEAQQQAEQAASFLGCTSAELMNPFDLGAVVSSKTETLAPQKIVVYGVPGIGKTTFASTFPNPILLRTEDGAAALDIPTFPKVLQNLQEVDQALSALRREHDYKTLIIDSLDWLEPMVWQYVCMEGQKSSIEDFGYGKGYVKADEVWRRLQRKIDFLRVQRQMHIVTIAHAVPVTVDPPDLESYQRYSMKLHKRGASLWIEWADMLLFTNYRTHVVQSEEGKTRKAKGSGERVIFTQERPAYQAKSRWAMDDEIFVGNDSTWAAFHENLREATQGAYNV